MLIVTFFFFFFLGTSKTNLNLIAFTPPIKEVGLIPQAPVIVQALDQTYNT